MTRVDIALLALKDKGYKTKLDICPGCNNKTLISTMLVAGKVAKEAYIEWTLDANNKQLGWNTHLCIDCTTERNLTRFHG